jgi:hypothetical protein
MIVTVALYRKTLRQAGCARLEVVIIRGSYNNYEVVIIRGGYNMR